MYFDLECLHLNLIVQHLFRKKDISWLDDVIFAKRKSSLLTTMADQENIALPQCGLYVRTYSYTMYTVNH